MAAISLVVLLAACGTSTIDDGEIVVEYFDAVPLALDTTDVKELDGSTVSGDISLQVRDHPRLTAVVFHLDDPDQSGEPLHVDEEAPYSMDLNTRDLTEGEHTLTIATRVTRGHAPVDTQTFVVRNAPTGETPDETPGDGDPDPAGDGEEPTEPTEPTEPSDGDTGTGDGAGEDDAGDDQDGNEGDVGDGTDGDGTDGEGEGDDGEAGEPAIGIDGEALTWAPPRLSDPTTVRVSQSSSGQTLNLDGSRDYIIEMPDEPLRSGLKISGGRNVVLIGGEIDIPWQGDNPTVQSRTGLRIHNVTGTIHVEGLLMHGDDISEGIQISAPDAIVQIQNVGIFDIRARDQVGFTDNHPDLIQTYGNVRELRVDRFTGSTDYQGLMLKVDFGGEPHGAVKLKRVNLIGNPTARYLMWVKPESGYGDIVMEDVWFDVYEGRNGGLGKSIWPDVNASSEERLEVGYDDQGTFAWWPNLTSPYVSGGIREGRPTTGSYVPRDEVGLAYASPGYSGGETLLAGR